MVLERGLWLHTGGSFHRPESAQARDLAMLAAIVLRHERQGSPLRVLDVMGASAGRGARYLAHAQAHFVWSNDASHETHRAAVQNLRAHATHPPSLHPLPEDPMATAAAPWTSGRYPGAVAPRWRLSHEDGRDLLLSRTLARDRYDLVDVDAFGAYSACNGPALDVVSYGGLVYVTSTDGQW